MKRLSKKKVEEFLRESNAIERVYDEQSCEDALEAWNYLMEHDELTISVILETHAILMKNQPNLYQDEKGFFRTIDVWIGGRKGEHPSMIAPRMQMDFVFETMRAHPMPDWQALHVTYEKIHPFVDGNGRTGRMFMNWTRVKRCDLPVLVIHEGDEQLAYYKWFRE